MTKKQLERLILIAGLEDDQEIFVAIPTHDHWGNVLARPLYEADFAQARKSDYYEGKLKIVDDTDEDTESVFVLYVPKAY